MNLIQHYLLKLGEESGEIATALLSNEALISGTFNSSDCNDIYLEINGLEAVIRTFEKDFDFKFLKFISLGHENFATINADKDLSFWVMYTVKACIALSKMTSKCMQFGLQEKPAESNLDNYTFLCNAMRDVFFGIDRMNTFGLGYTADEMQIKSSMDRIEHYLNDSILLGCVSNQTVLEKFLPIQLKVILDEWSYSADKTLDQSKDQSPIELPKTWAEIPIPSKDKTDN